jgi:hypothetical protein
VLCGRGLGKPLTGPRFRPMNRASKLSRRYALQSLLRATTVANSVWPVTCAHCSKVTYKPVGHVNRSEARGLSLYCDRKCSGLGRRTGKTSEQRKADKAEYDRQLRAVRGEELAAKRRAARLKLLAENPALVRQREKVNRDANRDRHAEYCRTPEYRKWKAEYDRKHLARKQYGPFAEAALTLRALEEEISGRASRTEIYAANGTLNKTQRRKREYEQATHCRRS